MKNRRINPYSLMQGDKLVTKGQPLRELQDQMAFKRTTRVIKKQRALKQGIRKLQLLTKRINSMFLGRRLLG
jgi:cell fate (sporulation/competence/biofilm development) regulator YmcA (YheA/YmcA/DUF963 family)